MAEVHASPATQKPRTCGAIRELTRTASLNPEELLASKSRIRILKALALKGSLNISGIKRCTGLNHRSILRALQVLKYMGVVGEVRLERTRSFRIKVENEEGSEVDRLIRCLEDLEGGQVYCEGITSSSGNTARSPTTRYKAPSRSSALVTD